MKGKKVIGTVLKIAAVGSAIGGVQYRGKKKLKEANERAARGKAYYTLENQWVMNKIEGKSMDSYFKENNMKTIAIYGMGTLGELFYEDIKDSDIKVSYFIDKNADELYYGLDDISVVNLKEMKKQNSVDAIVITPVYDYDMIVDDLEKEGIETEFVSLEDVVYEL